jgi:hypothetical protein
MTQEKRLEDHLLPSLPAELIRACYERGDGNELERKFFSPESSAALAANAFGLFLGREALLPPLPGTADLGWPATFVDLESPLRLPWRGGRHPNLDVVIATRMSLIGVESKRYEPFRGKSAPTLSAAYDRDVWGDNMAGYERIRIGLRDKSVSYPHLDAAQLVKHALGLLTATRKGTPHSGKRPILHYLFAEPETWASGRPVAAQDRLTHREEIRDFAAAVAGNEVTFLSGSYDELMVEWALSHDSVVREHAAAVEGRFLRPQAAASAMAIAIAIASE